ncbi:MAG TPA: extracellular solute-binding protein [Solirubrobacteraceae bacterium]|nr:extracellular solute-binding protein [Solirubrobacteraceae bacterium]
MCLATTYADSRADTNRPRRRRRPLRLGFGGLGLSLLLAACGSGSSTATPAAHSTGAAHHSGDVDVLSAGSLDTLLTQKVGPAFHAATGYTLVDTSGGSGTLAADIRNRTTVADVFLSASPKVDSTLQGAQNGNWVHWYADFATSPYVLAYAPQSRFASALKSRPWYKVITMSGFRLGRTDPTQDPGGVLAVQALTQTAAAQHEPTLAHLASETSDVYQETAEQSGIENGQLDASFMYLADANSQHSPSVPLTGTHLEGHYTITELNHAPHSAAAQAFIAFLVGPQGQALLRGSQFGVTSPAVVHGSGVPAALRTALGR